MKLKFTVIAGVLAAGMVAAPAFASESAASPFTKQDKLALFEQADKPMQLAPLSSEEMIKTEGAFIRIGDGLPKRNPSYSTYW